MSIWLVEIDAWNGTAVERINLATSAIITSPTDTPPNTVYEGRLSDPGSIYRAMFSGGVISNPSTSYGFIEVANSDGALDDWFNYAFDGRPFSVKLLTDKAQSVASARTVFRGTLAGIDLSDGILTIRFPIRDRLSELSVPLLSNRYAGTTISTGLGIEGNEDLKDRIKPRIFGSVTNVSGVLVNQFDLLYQFSDSAVASIFVYDGRLPLTFFADYPNVASLIVDEMPPGFYATCLSQGIVRLGGMPIFDITADVVEGTDSSASAIVGRMLDAIGVTSVDRDLSTFTALRLANAATVGIFLDAETNAIDAIEQILSSIGASIVPTALGQFQVLRVSAPSGPVADLTIGSLLPGSTWTLGIGPEKVGVPAWSVSVTYGRVWTVMSASQVAGAVSLEERSFVAAQSRKEVATSPAVKTAHPLASEVTVETLLAAQSAASAEAARLLSLYSVRRDRLGWALPIDQALWDMGQVLRVTFGRYGYETGRNMLIVGRRDDFGKRMATYELWG